MYDWSWENNISTGRDLIHIDQPHEYKYNPWRTLSSLSNYSDTLPYANRMNLNYHLSDKMQYHYLFYSIRKQKRFSRKKSEQDKIIEKQIKDNNNLISLIQEYYKYNNVRAKEALKILTEEQLNIIRKKQEKGG